MILHFSRSIGLVLHCLVWVGMGALGYGGAFAYHWKEARGSCFVLHTYICIVYGSCIVVELEEVEHCIYCTGLDEKDWHGKGMIGVYDTYLIHE